MMIAKIIDKCD